ncbi:MAG: electron transport complex subunit RsxC, partial [Gammaproteobacteria bacterium]
DGKDEAITQQAPNLDSLTAPELVDLIRRAGIVGLGGATFPTSAKLSRGVATGIDTLIINGAECEPYITSDDMLMQAYSDEVVRGTGYLQRIFRPLRTLIAIENDKTRAIEAIDQALSTVPLEKTELVVVPAVYPSGGEKQLVKNLTGKEVPQGQLAFDIGIFCQNVGTCVAITRTLEQGEALISRIVTVSGNGVRQPGNWETRLGTPIDHLIELAGGYRIDRPDSQHLVMGGPMMGFSLTGGRVPIVKASNNILVMRQQAIPPVPGFHDECVRCGKCAEVCPAQLLPQQLYWQARAKAYARSEEYRLFDCIECGCCSTVCPSQIPLVQYYRAAKSEIRATKQAQFKSDRVRVRFESREKRLLLRKQHDEERRRLKREALQMKRPKNKAAGATVDPVQAALDRVRAKKQALNVEPGNTTNLRTEQQLQITQADARRRAARQARQ